jgi:eukaryotic-like serine/threonine-protein kinase
VLTSLKHAQEFAVSVAHDYPENGDLQFNLAGADKDLGGLLSAMGKTSEGLEWFGKALAIHRKMIEASPSTSSYRSSLAETLRCRGIELQRCGRAADAVRDFRQSITILRELTEPTAGDYYNMARAQSLISGAAAEAGSGLSAAEVRAATEAAMTTLHRAIAAGWQDFGLMRVDTELDPIRDRDDFRLLLMDLAMPVDPFAAPR